MKQSSKQTEQNQPIRVRPALSPEAETSQCIALATSLVKERLLNGTATSQETTFFLKLGTKQHELEIRKLERENELLTAKTNNLNKTNEDDVDYKKVYKALRKYRGQPVEDDEDEDYD